MPGLITKKVGMTQVFEPDGRVVPVTILQAEPNAVVRTRTKENRRLYGGPARRLP